MEFSEISVNSVNAANLINHWSVYWGQFKDDISHMWLAGAVVASWSLTQGPTGSNPFYCNDKFLVTEFSELNESI